MLEGDADNSKVINGGGFSQLQSCFGDCSSEEELTVLPRHTKVVVTGNNRTKSVLVGLQGVVKKAVGLGGWHWLVLTNGIEVKLQRNALSVIEAPTGNEEDDDIEVEHIQWNNPSHMISDDSLKTHKAKQRGYRSARLSQKTMCRALSCDSHSKRQSITPRANMKVDLSKLDMPALQRYIQHFNLVDALPNPSKEQLLDIVQRHFMAQEMDELQVIVGFVQAAKGMKKACRWKSKEHRNTDLNKLLDRLTNPTSFGPYPI
ncbi:PREDICTED: LOW QUALITY PROTEIN: uncharacterized protein LOC106297016 [Brassica oleracea var. oleracea]|uniref:LOW QUALITY PROTEIN: uncharacterized protein LOC106297016 n=1 Tax=Brassica oleracea var. oleracea TaxID=109376 RepID=UPI0006A71032|nr:PREDICTED: LOW QUALITY PROTEIN: uncharacterized protein LOC106297016 [Brassica oleracea var. oleracea]